ncbi:DUF6449 domain-containing protein [Bacillus pinisoli]|uniref:DUF6449 domain-containing protein n=1 Tax=Bacillus pinisoli TaxID=2901866 RepID=UPI001FF48840|nr:DUF6449 domain-containing protein [Bacillus pinisoli]
MQSKTSWFNREIILQGFRSTGWLAIIYFLGVFFALPLRMMMYVSEEDSMYRYKFFQDNNLFSWNPELLTLFSGIVPVLVAVFIFRYVQTKSSSDLIHSLPVTRTQLYFHYVGTGALFLILPVLLNVVILFIIHPVLGLSAFFTGSNILYWAGITIVINLLIFMASVFVGMISGISIIHGVLSYVLLFSPVGFALLITFSLDMFLFGFTPDIMTGNKLEKLSPLIRMGMFNSDLLSTIEVWIYLGLTILLLVLSLVLYKKRRLEAISNPIVFPFLRPIFKYGVTFATMLLGGLYFGQLQNSLGWTIVGYVIGSIIGYLVSEMILQKTWRVLGSLKGYGIYVVGVVVLFLVIHFDVFGYEKRIPELAEIERIYHGHESYMYLNQEEYGVPIEYFHEQENFENITNLHQAIIEHKSELKSRQNIVDPEYVYIAYELKNGKRVMREYTISKSEYASLLRPIYESNEFKLVNFRVMGIEADGIDKIFFTPSGGIQAREVTITDEAEIEELLSLLKEDILNLKYEQYQESTISDIRFDMKVDNPHFETHHSISASYVAVEKWLKEKGIYEKAVLSGEDFEYAILLGDHQIDLNEYYSMSNEAMLDKINSLENTVKITNPADLLEAWKSTNGDHSKGTNIVFKYKNQPHVDFRVIDKDVAKQFK